RIGGHRRHARRGDLDRPHRRRRRTFRPRLLPPEHMTASMPLESEADSIIQVQTLSIGYGGKALLRELSFDVRRGEVLVILGGSGSGKSTLLKHMIGLQAPLSGRVLIGGEDIVRAEGERRQALLRRFGVMYQHGALFGSMTLLENVQLPL